MPHESRPFTVRNSCTDSGLKTSLETPPIDRPLEANSQSLLVTLSSGEQLDISQFDSDELQQLQWREERAYAAQIAASAAGSRERKDLYRQGYDAVTTIYARIVDRNSKGLVMGFDRRYATVARQLLARSSARCSRPARVFEIGYGCGALLAELPGVDVAGIEVSATMRDQARRRLGDNHPARLYLGDFLTQDLSAESNCDLVFWNDVLEHLAPDEVPHFLRRIHDMLTPGGYLVTITPNWHMRPSDVTMNFCPPRTTAVGFHLKEYSLREVTSRLRDAGFARVATPLFITHGRIVLSGSGLAGAKRVFEPLLEWVPFRLARVACRALGLSFTIAQRTLE
jgi:SAM-dependent methyltransferase